MDSLSSYQRSVLIPVTDDAHAAGKAAAVAYRDQSLDHWKHGEYLELLIPRNITDRDAQLRFMRSSGYPERDAAADISERLLTTELPDAKTLNSLMNVVKENGNAEVPFVRQFCWHYLDGVCGKLGIQNPLWKREVQI